MACPLLRRSHPAACRAVAGAPAAVGAAVIATYCRGPYGGCPAYRFVRAAGHAVHPADFRAWVLLGVPPGRLDPLPDPPPATDDR